MRTEAEGIKGQTRHETDRALKKNSMSRKKAPTSMAAVLKAKPDILGGTLICFIAAS